MPTALLTREAAAIERIKALVLDSVSSENSKQAYGFALDYFLRWSRREHPDDGFTRATVQRYRSELEEQGLAPSTINLRLAAIRKLAVEAEANGLIAHEAAAGIAHVKGVGHAGVRIGTWLTPRQAEQLLAAPNSEKPKGRRDRAILAVLVGCGLRRDEATDLTIEHIQQREGRWMLVDLIGKGKRIRSVPMPSWTKVAIDVWTTGAGITTGPVFRSVSRGGRIVSEQMPPQNIRDLVKGYGKKIGVPNLNPHDLRRTFAKLAHKGRAALEQIQLSLGHSSIVTTERYLGVTQDLTDAPCDHLGLKVEVKE
jgi:site-specific recombinase XerD